MDQSLAVDLPLELHSRIIGFLDLETRDRDVKPDVQRRQLCKLSLTCRYWAYFCRPLAFKLITFRRRQQVDTLIHLLNAPTQVVLPRLQSCLFTTCSDTLIFTDAWAGFWVRLMSNKLPYRSGMRDLHCQLAEVHVPPSSVSLQSEGGYAPRSWSTGLPRTLPPNLIHIRELSLDTLRFRHAHHFVSLLEGIRHLDRLICTNISFAETQVVEFPVRIRRHKGPAPFNIFVSECESRDVDLRVAMTSMQFSPRHGAPGYRLGEDAWGLVRDVIRSLMTFWWDRDNSIRLRTVPQLAGIFAALDVSFPTPRVPPSHGIRIIWTLGHPAPFDVPATGHVYLIQIVFWGDKLPKDGPEGLEFTLESLDWPRFEAAALVLDPYDGVQITVVANDRAYAWLLDQASVHGSEKGSLRSLYESGKLALDFDLIRGGEGVKLSELSAAPEEYLVDGSSVPLDLRGRFEVWRCGYDEQGREVSYEEAEAATQAYLRRLLAQGGDAGRSRRGNEADDFLSS